jgi:hypothetical protein
MQVELNLVGDNRCRDTVILTLKMDVDLGERGVKEMLLMSFWANQGG